MDVSAFEAPASADGGTDGDGEEASLFEPLCDDLKPAVLALLAVIKHVVLLAILLISLFLCATLYIFVLSWTCLFWLQTRLFFLTSVMLRGCMDDPQATYQIANTEERDERGQGMLHGSTKGRGSVPSISSDEKVRDGTRDGQGQRQHGSSSSEKTYEGDNTPGQQYQPPFQEDSEPSCSCRPGTPKVCRGSINGDARGQSQELPGTTELTIDEAQTKVHERSDNKLSAGNVYRSGWSTYTEDHLTQLNARIKNPAPPPAPFTVEKNVEPEQAKLLAPTNATSAAVGPRSWALKGDVSNPINPVESVSAEADREPCGFTADQLAEARKFSMEATRSGQNAGRGKAPQHQARKRKLPLFQTLVNKPADTSSTRRAQSAMLHTTAEPSAAPPASLKKTEPGLMPPHKREAMEGKANRASQESEEMLAHGASPAPATDNPVVKLPPVVRGPSKVIPAPSANVTIVKLSPVKSKPSAFQLPDVNELSIKPSSVVTPAPNGPNFGSERLVKEADKDKAVHLDCEDGAGRIQEEHTPQPTKWDDFTKPLTDISNQLSSSPPSIEKLSIAEGLANRSTASQDSKDFTASPPVAVTRITEDSQVAELKQKVIEPFHTANEFDAASASPWAVKKPQATEPKQESSQPFQLGNEFEAPLVSQQTAKILIDQVEQIKQSKGIPVDSNEKLIDFNSENESSAKNAVMSPGNPALSFGATSHGSHIIPPSASLPLLMGSGPHLLGAMSNSWSDIMHPYNFSLQPPHAHPPCSRPNFGYPPPGLPVPLVHQNPVPHRTLSHAMSMCSPPPGFAMGQLTSQATFDAVLDEDLHGLTAPKARPQQKLEHSKGTDPSPHAPAHAIPANQIETLDTLNLKGQCLPFGTVDNSNGSTEVKGLLATSNLQLASLQPPSTTGIIEVPSEALSFQGSQTQITSPDVNKATLEMRQIDSLNSTKDFSEDAKVPYSFDSLLEKTNEKTTTQDTSDVKISEFEELPPVSADIETETTTNYPPIGRVPGSTELKQQWKQKKNEAREALREAWCDREDARKTVISTWTIEGAKALMQATVAYNKKRDALKELMLSGQFNDDDERVFPLFGNLDLVAPKHRPTGIAEIKRRRATKSDKSDKSDNNAGESSGNTRSEGDPALAHQCEATALKERLIEARTLLQQAHDYFKQPQPQSSIKYETWKQKGDAWLERATKFYRKKRETLAATLPSGWPPELLEEFPEV